MRCKRGFVIPSGDGTAVNGPNGSAVRTHAHQIRSRHVRWGDRRFVRCRDGRRGIVTIELAVVLPLVALIVLGVMEVGTLFYVRHLMVHAAWDATRQLSVRGVTPAQAEQIALDRLTKIAAPFSIMATEQDSGVPGQRDVSVEINVPRSDVSLGIPLLGLNTSGTVQVKATMRKESD